MPTKLIHLPASTTDDKIEIMCRLIAVGSPIEISVIKAMYALNNGATCFFPIEERANYCLKNKIKLTTFSVSLSRLIDKGVIVQKGLTFMLHPAFRDLNQCDSLKIQFNEKQA